MSHGPFGSTVEKLVTFDGPTLCTVYNLLQRLPDPRWMYALEKFLCKENPWEDPNFSTWKTIKLGTHKDVQGLKEALMEAGVVIGDSASDIMSGPNFTLASEEVTIELFIATVTELGLSGRVPYGAICARIKELGYALCPAEVGPQLCRQYTDHSKSEWWYLAMEPIPASSDDDLSLFAAHQLDDRRRFRTHRGRPRSVYGTDSPFVFMRCK